MDNSSTQAPSGPCFFFSVGEPSGDLHGANLITALLRRSPGTRCVGYGGPRMRQAGLELQHDLTTLAIMWFWDAIRQLATFWRLYRQAGDYFDSHHVDAVILIDYPGFNWWVARAAKRRGIPVFYYGVPQLWAWAPWRIKKMRRLVDLALCKLPFEANWFSSRGVRAISVGHPYYDEIAGQNPDSDFIAQRQDSEHPWVVLLPGSRQVELDRNLESLVATAERIALEVPKVRFAVSCLREHHAQQVHARLERSPLKSVEVHAGRTPEWIRLASFCVACSGSVSLELLYHEKPSVIVYRIPRWSLPLTKLLLRVRFVTLVNLLWADTIERRDWQLFDPDAPGAELVPFPEYVTCDDPSERVARQIIHWLHRSDVREQRVAMLRQLKHRHVQLGASTRAAEVILQELAMTSATHQASRAA